MLLHNFWGHEWCQNGRAALFLKVHIVVPITTWYILAIVRSVIDG
jgi:hypothetical protein